VAYGNVLLASNTEVMRVIKVIEQPANAKFSKLHSRMLKNSAATMMPFTSKSVIL
jgi:hypothetical protein